MRAAPISGPTFDAFGEPIAALPARERASSARAIGIVAFWLIAVLLVAGRFLVPVPSFDRATAPTAATESATTVAQAQGPALR